jgi:hypothetical protein
MIPIPYGTHPMIGTIHGTDDIEVNANQKRPIGVRIAAAMPGLMQT